MFECFLSHLNAAKCQIHDFFFVALHKDGLPALSLDCATNVYLYIFKFYKSVIEFEI